MLKEVMLNIFKMLIEGAKHILIIGSINNTTGLPDRMHTEHRTTNINSFNSRLFRDNGTDSSATR
jgi:hypothetical protein